MGKRIATDRSYRAHLVLALSQERERLVKKLWQIRQDVDSYNENVNPGDPIVFVFDFTNDMNELEAARLAKRAGEGGSPRG